MSQLGEDIIAAWMQLIAAIGDRWVVSGLSFNEALVCNLLSRRREDGGCLTASELCAKTKILKSQMNAILRSLEEKSLPALPPPLTGGWWRSGFGRAAARPISPPTPTPCASLTS